jgi:uncharacterized heparinase superfamily protein
VLEGVHLVTDCGTHLYTASMFERNLFRSTASHNTPNVDGEEINRFVRPDYLWRLHNDAEQEIEPHFACERDVVRMHHTGYRRLPSPVTVRRVIALDHAQHALTISDALIGEGSHAVEIPLHLAPGVRVVTGGSAGNAMLVVGARRFELTWSPAADWNMTVEATRVSPTYGVTVPSSRIVWRRHGHGASLSAIVKPVLAQCSR